MEHPDKKFLYSRVGTSVSKARHYVGLPEAIDPEGRRTPRPPAALLIVEPNADGIFLLRFSSSGEFGGDSWHETVDDAKHQASFEYGNDLAWQLSDRASSADELVAELLGLTNR